MRGRYTRETAAHLLSVTLQHGLIAEKQYRRKQEHGLLI